MSADHPGTRSRQHLPWAIAAIAVVALVANLLWERPGDDGADAALAELTERLDALEAGPPRRSPQVSPGRIDAAAGVEGGDASILGATEQTPAEIAEGIAGIMDHGMPANDAERWRDAHRYSKLAQRLHAVLIQLARRRAPS